MPTKPQAAKRRIKLTLEQSSLRYLVPKETIAERYSVSPRTIEFWVRKRRIPAIKVGRELRFRIEECDRAVDRFVRRAAGEIAIDRQQKRAKAPQQEIARLSAEYLRRSKESA